MAVYDRRRAGLRSPRLYEGTGPTQNQTLIVGWLIPK